MEKTIRNVPNKEFLILPAAASVLRWTLLLESFEIKFRLVLNKDQIGSKFAIIIIKHCCVPFFFPSYFFFFVLHGD